MQSYSRYPLIPAQNRLFTSLEANQSVSFSPSPSVLKVMIFKVEPKSTGFTVQSLPEFPFKGNWESNPASVALTR